MPEHRGTRGTRGTCGRARVQLDQAGVTLVELCVATTVLLIALAGILTSFAQAQQRAASDASRSVDVDNLRLAANIFAKDVREATTVTVADANKVVMDTTVNQTPQTVT